MKRRPEALLVPRLRVMRGEEILLGPGKADLLALIEQLGTIREAANELDMSYMRAWKLVHEMNEGFREPLVVMRRGGKARGGAELTTAGRLALRLYRGLERDAVRGTRKSWAALRKMLS